MADDKSFSLVNLGKLSKPADTLIKKVSSAVGGIFEPWLIKRLAKAEAEASLIKTKAEIEITDLHRRAMHRFVEEEALRQGNMERITEQAIPLLSDDSNPDEIENDWITNFFDKSRIVSDSEMQKLWSNVLAREANAPGTYSKRTVNFLSDLDKRDAELFQALCRFGWVVRNFTPLIFEPDDEIYNDAGISFGALTHLDSIGLIQLNNLSGFQATKLPKSFLVSYCGRPLQLEMQKDDDNHLPIGKVLLSKVGEELATIIRVPGVDKFEDYVKEKWRAYIPNLESTEQSR